MTDTATKFRTLPASQARVPAEPAYALSGYKSLRTHDGVAATVTVRVGKTVVGMIEDAGNGGGVYFHPHDRAAREQWETYERQYAVLNPQVQREPDGTYTELPPLEPGTAQTIEFDKFVYVPDAADALLIEAELIKRITGSIKRGRTICRKPVTDLRKWAEDGHAYASVNTTLDRCRTMLIKDGYEAFTLDRGWLPAAEA